MSPEQHAEALQEEAERRIGIEADRRFEQQLRLPSPPPDHSGFRFSPEDEARARAALRLFAEGLPSSWSTQAKLAQIDQAVRIGANSIGLGLPDLREIEEAWLRTEGRRQLVGIPQLEAGIERARARRDEGIGGAEIDLAGLRGRLRAARILIGEISGEEG